MDAKPYKIPRPFHKLSKELIDKIIKDLSEGSTKKHASLANGITHRIFDIWVKQGKIDLEFENANSLPAYLVLSLAKIEQDEVKWCRENIKFSPKGHAGAQWTLEHAYWRDFSSNIGILELGAEIEELKNNLKGANFDGGKEVDSENGDEEGSAS